ncbi:DUF1269 domain-containing protein [Aquabacter sp. CN5-332]|uniref:DUF1269 domain-containing protein n=1 Tax=Aquabacter sp. CN5-332 TaxID=3156608 RepID=UPI0032B6169E
MADLVIIAYDSEQKAEAARQELLKLQREYLIELGDAVIAVRQEDGTIKLHQMINTTLAGAASGSLWGGLVGLLFLNPLIGMAVGAGAGAIAGKFTDTGINDDFIRDASSALGNGQAALCVLIRKVTADKVVADMAQFGGTVLRTNLSNEQEEKLQAALRGA